jgi:hypothetical protein
MILALLGAITAAGFVAASGYANYHFFGWLGILPVAVNTLAPFWLLQATQKTLRLTVFVLWTASILYSFTAAIGYGATNRQETANTMTAHNLNYKMELKTLAEFEASPKTPQNKVIAQRQKVAAMRMTGALNESEPHITLIASLIPASRDSIKLAYLMIFSFIIEIGAAVTLFASLQQFHTRPVQLDDDEARWNPHTKQWDPIE